MNKKILGIAAGALVILVGAYFLLFANKTQEQSPEELTQEETLEEISKEELGLEFELCSDKRSAKFTISNASDIDSVEYELRYDKEINDQHVTEGLTGDEINENGKDTLGTSCKVFGTCSSGVCRYDNVVSDIKLYLKITKTDGKVYQAEDSLEL